MKYILYFLVIALVILFIYLLFANKHLTVKNYEFRSDLVTSPIRVVHLSDIHNDLFGKGNRNLIKKVKELKPDVIFITGDLIDSRRTNMDRGIHLVRKLIKIAPIYYVSGNHEGRIKEYPYFEKKIKEEGVTVLNCEKTQYKCFNIYGLQDPGFYCKDKHHGKIAADEKLKQMDIIKDNEHINVLLAHRPHYFDIYCQYDLDYIFSGHAHGGQMRLPIVGGLYAPGQGILPKYDAGLYKKDHTTMILSRGLGNSLFPLRIFDDPQIITIEFKSVHD